MNLNCKVKNEFWITNISNRNISLSDLNLTIKANCSVNLLDKRHYNFTLEQLNDSLQKGSISKKNNVLFLRKVPPVIEKNNNFSLNTTIALPSRERSSVTIVQERYEELNISDEQFASENADLITSNKV